MISRGNSGPLCFCCSRCALRPFSSRSPSSAVRAALPSPQASWLFRDDDGRAFINLPPTDNWSEAHPLSTTWQRLRVQGQIERGQTHVYVDLTDTTYATSNGRIPSHGAPSLRTHVPWGVAKDCRGAADLVSEYRLNLRGTPFQLPSLEPARGASGPQAHGRAACDGVQEQCAGRCGGACGVCGFRYGEDTQLVRLVVADRFRFDDAIAQSCGRPQMANVDFGACDWHFMGVCNPICRCSSPRGHGKAKGTQSGGVRSGWEGV